MTEREELRKTVAELPVIETIVLDPEEEPPPEEVPEKKRKKPTKAEIMARKLKEQEDEQRAEIRFDLKQEMEMSRRAVIRGRADWEEMCREIKIEELLVDMQTCAEKAEKSIERKDELIKLLVSDIDSVKDMHKRMSETHAQIMDFITDVHKCFLTTMKQLYEANCTGAIQDFYEELNERTAAYNEEKLNRENIMHSSNMIFERTLGTDLKIFKDRQDDQVNTQIAKRYRVRDGVLEEMKNLRKELLAFIEKLSNTELDPHKYERIHGLMDRQRQFVRETRKLNNVESVQMRNQCELQRDLLHKEVEGQHKITDLKMEQVYFQKVREEIEKSIQTERETMSKKLIELATESNKTLEKYKKMEKQGENILLLAAACRKLMTEKEKIIPWENFKESEAFEETEFQKHHFRMQSLDLAQHLDLNEEQLAKQANRMRNFWRRVAQVEMHNMLMVEEKRRLTAENEQYCERIRNLGHQPTTNYEELFSAVTVSHLLVEEKPPCDKSSTKKSHSSVAESSGGANKSISEDQSTKSSNKPPAKKSSIKNGKSSRKKTI